MKILLTVHQFLPAYAAGTEILTYTVARELMRRGHTVVVMTGRPDEQAPHQPGSFEYDLEGIYVHNFRGPASGSTSGPAGQGASIASDYDNQAAAAYFGQLLDDFKPDVAHFFHLGRLGSGLIEAAVSRGVPRFMTATDFWPVCPTSQLVCADGTLCSGPSRFAGNCVRHFATLTQRGLLRQTLKYVPKQVFDVAARLTQRGALGAYPYREQVASLAARLPKNVARFNQLNGLLAPNSFMRETLIANGIAAPIVHEVAFGIERAPASGARPRAAPAHPLRAGFVGALAPHKGCHVLIDAIQSLPVGRATLKVYGDLGQNPDYVDDLRRRAAGNASIQFLGTFPNAQIGAIFEGLDVLVVPSMWHENSPLVLFSAQAAFCPVIASNFPGISATIRDEANGLLFPAGDVTALARQVTRFMDEPGLAQRLSENAEPPKSIETYVDELLDLWGRPS